MDMIQFKEQLFEQGNKHGFTEMELYYQSTNRFNTQLFNGEVDGYKVSSEGGVSSGIPKANSDSSSRWTRLTQKDVQKARVPIPKLYV